MSFDTDFPFSYLTTVLQQNITKSNVSISIIDDKLLDVGNLTGNITYLSNIGITQLNTTKSSLESDKWMYQEMLSEINGIVTLSNEDKGTLYDFYQESNDVIGTMKNDYVQRMLFNVNDMIPHAANVLSEVGGMSVSEKEISFQIVCEMFPAHANTTVLFEQLVTLPF